MKKLLGLLALAIVSNFAFAEQDTLKEFHFSTQVRQGYIDKSKNDSNGLGFAAFKKDNRDRFRIRTIFGGDMNLVDEGNLGLRFNFENDQDRDKGSSMGSVRSGNPFVKGTRDEKSTWENDIALYKEITLGSWTSTWDLGWKYKTTRGKGDFNNGHRGTSNEIYFGPKIGFNLFGQNISAKTQLVYFDATGGRNGDNAWSGNEFTRGKVSGWGANLDLATDGKFFENGAGDLGYYVELNNRLRDASGKLAATGKEAKSSVYLDYIVGATYTTPSFAGFYGQINVENEWEKHTATTGYVNNFTVWTNAGYKTSFDTPVGELSINPFVKLAPIHKETEKYKDGNQTKKFTQEYTQFRAGLGFGLKVK